MQEPSIPADEECRLTTLHSLDLLDTPAEERFDRLVRLAQRLFDVPIALFTLLDSDRQWFKSAIGIDIGQTPRALSFCGHTILKDDVMVVEDTSRDPRFVDNPYVVAVPNIRFYAGKSVTAPNGQRIGTLCLLDDKPRHFSAQDTQMLCDLVAMIENETHSTQLKSLNQRLQQSERELRESLTQLREAERQQRARNKSLELIARGYPLYEVLKAITVEIEQCNPGFAASIEVNDNNGGQPQCYWGDRLLHQPIENLDECCTEYIFSSSGQALGHLSILRAGRDDGDECELKLVKLSANLASIAIERDQADRMIWKQANYDSLTGLPNRNLMRERLEQEMLKARRHRFELALLFIDLDHFKQVNDTFGHQKGDELLAQVGKRLEECVRESDTVARLGGDEFTLIAVELRDQQDAQRVADKVLTELAREFRLGAESVYLSASIGIAFYPDHGEDMNALIRSADRAMYNAKNSGKNQLSIYGKQQKPPCPKNIIPAVAPKP